MTRRRVLAWLVALAGCSSARVGVWTPPPPDDCDTTPVTDLALAGCAVAD